MSIEIVIKQKGLFKKTMPPEVLLANKLKYGTYEAGRFVNGRFGASSFIAYDPESMGRGIMVAWSRDERYMLAFGLPQPSTPSEIRNLYDMIERAVKYWNADLYYDGIRTSLAEFLAGYEYTVDFNAQMLKLVRANFDDGDEDSKILFNVATCPIYMSKKEATEFETEPEKYYAWLHSSQAERM